MAEPTVSVERPLPPDVTMTLVGLMEETREEEEADVVRMMVPVKPPRLVRRTVDVALTLVDVLRDVGVAVIEKSGTLTVMVLE